MLALEDLSDHVVWRTALNRGERHEGAAGDLGRYVARTAFGSSVLGRDPLEQKLLLAEAVNPELCQITEDLVLTEPFVEHEHNSYLPQLADDVRALADDPVVRRRIGGAKVAFMTKAAGAPARRPAHRVRAGAGGPGRRTAVDPGVRQRVRVLRADRFRPRHAVGELRARGGAGARPG